MIGIDCPLQEELEIRNRQAMGFCCISGFPLALADQIVEIDRRSGWYADASALDSLTAADIGKQFDRFRDIEREIEEAETELEILQSDLRKLKGQRKQIRKQLGIRKNRL